MTTASEDSIIDEIVRVLHDSCSILFITGAGVSADSGLPTYRGIGGLYDVDTTEEGYRIEEVLSAEMLSRRPDLTWKYLAQIGMAARGATHNRAHTVIAEMEQSFRRVWTVTQNVDGFHHSAGSQNLIEAHGNMRSLSCTRCDYCSDVDRFDAIALPPKCPDCDSLMRPDVVLFGELLQGDGIDELQRQLEIGFDVVFSIGTTSVFPYIQAPIYLAKENQKTSIEINPSETEVSSIVDFRLPMKAAESLSEIWDRYQRKQKASL